MTYFCMSVVFIMVKVVYSEMAKVLLLSVYWCLVHSQTFPLSGQPFLSGPQYSGK